MTLQETIDYLEELSLDDDVPEAIHILPPENENGVVSGEDDCTDEEEGILDNLCAGQLKANCEIVFRSGKHVDTAGALQLDESDDELTFDENILIDILDNSAVNIETNLLDVTVNEQSTSTIKSRLRKVIPSKSTIELPQHNKTKEFVWIKDNSTGMIPIFPPANYKDCEVPPHEQFEKFFNDDLFQHICEETGKYAIFLGKPNPNITVQELKVFIGILLVSGYNYHSRIRTAWSTDDDMVNILIKNSMRRNRFQQILQFLHFEDSYKKVTDSDKMWKLRPITDHLKANMLKHFHPEQHLSYDESMIAYFGRHGCKQFR